MDIRDILNERQNTHGAFGDNAAAAQALKEVINGHGINELMPEQAEALDMICHKIARIICGNPDYKDHWADIAGYAELVARDLSTPQSDDKCKLQSCTLTE